MHDFEFEFFERSSDAVLICQQRNQKDKTIEVIWVNTQAKNILGWIGEVPTPFPIEQLIPSSEFHYVLGHAISSRQKQSGLLGGLTAVDTETPLFYEVTTLSKVLLVQIKKEVQHKALLQAFGEHVVSTHLTGALALEAVRNTAGQVVDFRLIFQNQASMERPFLGMPIQIGRLLTDWYAETQVAGQLSRFVEVVETGQSYVLEKYYPEKDQTFQMAVSKHGDGILVSYFDRTPKQLAERKVQFQAQILQQLMDNNQDIIVLWEPVRDGEGHVIDLKASQFNKAALCDGFFTVEDYVYGTLTQMSTGAREFIPEYAKVLYTGTPYRVERFNRRGGKDLWTDVSVSRLDDKLLMIVRDITEQKKAIQEVEKQNHLLEGILNSSDNYILVTEAIRDETDSITDFRITKGNKITIDTLKNLFGFDAIGYSIKQLVGNKAKLFKEAIQVMETGQPYIKDRWHNSLSDRWYKFSLHKLNNGVVVNYVDITAIQKALLDVQQQKELVEGVLDSSINGILAMEVLRNSQGHIVDLQVVLANQAAEKYTFLPNSEIVGKTYLSLYPTAKEVGFFEKITRAIEENVPFRTEVAFPSPRLKTIRWFTLSLTQTSAGLVILTFVETTDQVLLRQKQDILLEELRQSNKDLEQFAYVASHDLQEPARKISSFANLVTKQYAQVLPQAGVDLLQRMQAASVRMQEMINGLLTYSQYSNQKEPHQAVPLQALIQSILVDLEEVIEKKMARIQVGELPAVAGNQIQLRQLFQNLLSNALKFVEVNTTPEISITAGKATQEEVLQAGLNQQGKWLAFRVKDNGIGIDSANAKKIFELFSRLHGRSQYAGNGLGLAICKRVAILHSGDIVMQSRPGEGTTFSVILPEPGSH